MDRLNQHQQLREIKRRLDSRKSFLSEMAGENPQDDILQEFYNWSTGRRRR